MRDEQLDTRELGAGSVTRSEPKHGLIALETGTRLDNRYIIDSVIAAGGFGITYLARHEVLGKTYAIKEHFPRQFAFRDGTTPAVRPTDAPTFRWALDRFIQEGRALATCKHPGIVDVSDVFEANGTAYMVLGYENGVSLKSWIEALGRPPTQVEIDAVLSPLLDALAFVHAQGLLHRDIAPDNIMIRSDGKPCLIDFGAARQAIAQRSTLMSAIVKTGYSPPEQYTSTGRAQGGWSDIYALAATIYGTLTGRPPQEATDRQQGDEVQPLARMLGVSSHYRLGFLSAVDRALVLKTVDRPQTVEAWRELLFAPDPPGGSAPAFPPVPRHRAARAATVASLGLLLLGGAGYMMVTAQKASTERARIAVEDGTRRISNATTIATLDEIAQLYPDLTPTVAARREMIVAAEARRIADETRHKSEAAQRLAAEAEHRQTAAVEARQQAEQVERIAAEAEQRQKAEAEFKQKTEEAQRLAADLERLKKAKRKTDAVQRASLAESKPQRATNRPNALAYSFSVFPPRSIQTGKSRSQSTQYGTLTCSGGDGTGGKTGGRQCNWN